MRKFNVLLVCVLGGSLAGGCAPSGEGLPPDQTETPDQNVDNDDDGFTAADGDCDDTQANVHPGAVDNDCDGVDNDCNGVIDDLSNLDGDLFSTCMGDCDDQNPDINPAATETPNSLDDDCDGIVDNNMPSTDDDGDGYSENDGDCNDKEPFVNPGAVEVLFSDAEQTIAEGVDNNCNGVIDEAPSPCDSGLNPKVAMDLVRSMDMCDWVTGADMSSLLLGNNDAARNILDKFGDVYVPRSGASMTVLATGLAVDSEDPTYTSAPAGTMFDTFFPSEHPNPQPSPNDGCGMSDPSSVYDYNELTVDLKVPSNAQALQFDFNFMSAEFPEFVCTLFDDTFMVLLESSSFNGNVSFDSQGRPVSINIGFFDVCAPSQASSCTSDVDLAGTGFENGVGGGTGWLETTAPVTPGENIRLRFIIFDEGDSQYDSLVLVDNFRWSAQPVDGPVTVDRQAGEELRQGWLDDSATQQR